MAILNLLKNVSLTLTVTTLYAVWSTKELHELSPLKMWAILIMFAFLVFHILIWADREAKRIHKERKKKNGREKK